MAVYRFSAIVIGRSGGRSATAAAAYRAAERIEDERTGLDHDYRRRKGVEFTETITPDQAPEWMHDRSKLWNAVEMGEKRKDAQLAREVQMALPHELNSWQRAELVREFVRDQFVSRGMVADVFIHAPDREGDSRNHHAHVMLSLRELTREGFGQKQREWNDKQLLENWREEWANYQNRAFERAGLAVRVDHRSYEARGIDKEPEPKLGPVASEMERRGKQSDRGDMLRDVWERNRKREELKREAEVIDLAIAREERKLREAAQREQAERYRQAAGQKEQAGQPANEQRRQEQQRKAEQQKRTEERARAYQKGRFEEWANRKRAETQSFQHEARIETERRHDRQRERLEERLASFYGAGLEEARKTLAEIEARQNAGKVARFAYRISGQAGRDREAAEAARANLADIENRMAEQRGRLESQQKAELATMDAAHRRQELKLEERIQNAYDRREREGWKEQDRQREAANESRQQERTGPEAGSQNGGRERGGREFG